MSVCCRLHDVDVTTQRPSCSAGTDVNCRSSRRETSCSSSVCVPRSQTAGSSSLAGAVLRGVDLSLAAVVLSSSQRHQHQPQMHIHVTSESPDRTTSGHSTPTPAVTSRPASAVGRRSAGVPHGSLRAFQHQQQQQQQQRQHHNTLLVVPSSRSGASSTLSVSSQQRGGSVSTSPSSASPSPSPEPISRHHASRSLSTQRPLGVTRQSADEHSSKPSRQTCVQRQRQLTAAAAAGQAATTADEQETFV